MAQAFFELEKTPAGHAALLQDIDHFISRQPDTIRIVFITSGGTIVPLEQRMVRFIDNFSGGRRGSASAEALLDRGYSVIFFHRKLSQRPFQRQLTGSTLEVLGSRDNSDELHGTDPATEDLIKSLLRKRTKAMAQHRLLEVEFKTVHDYLFGLRDISQRINQHFGARAMFYLAAAVSDFYIPAAELPQHKIQSRDGKLTIRLTQVPKMLGLLVSEWADKSLVVTFKLETDPDLLAQKACGALESYGHDLVIANLLPTRHQEVRVYSKHNMREPTVIKSPDQGADLEPALIAYLADYHSKWFQKTRQMSLS
eukprot:TRINITY_DN3033_c0_g1_i1.p1 TRINITY_DN3033_c0_g1~~TRINITY_DN3033_c0_g1_i1.p1  ORF type:complete len:311 (+),score=49.81 TRINITY_DN3033_c0_g1_i1:2-934(+)